MPPRNTERFRVLATNVGVAEFRLPIFDCKEEKKMPDVDLTIGIRPVLRFFERAKAAFVCQERGACFSFVSVQAPPNMAFSHLHRSLYP
jgi:hypothetical protein